MLRWAMVIEVPFVGFGVDRPAATIAVPAHWPRRPGSTVAISRSATAAVGIAPVSSHQRARASHAPSSAWASACTEL